MTAATPSFGKLTTTSYPFFFASMASGMWAMHTMVWPSEAGTVQPPPLFV